MVVPNSLKLPMFFSIFRKKKLRARCKTTIKDSVGLYLLATTAGLFVHALTEGGGAGENIFLAFEFPPAGSATPSLTAEITTASLTAMTTAAGDPSRTKDAASLREGGGGGGGGGGFGFGRCEEEGADEEERLSFIALLLL